MMDSKFTFATVSGSGVVPSKIDGTYATTGSFTTNPIFVSRSEMWSAVLTTTAATNTTGTFSIQASNTKTRSATETFVQDTFNWVTLPFQDQTGTSVTSTVISGSSSVFVSDSLVPYGAVQLIYSGSSGVVTASIEVVIKAVS